MSYISQFLSFITSKASAHVGYVIEQNDFNAFLGNDANFITSPLLDTKNILMIVGTIAASFVVYYLAYKIHFIRARVIALRMRLHVYNEFIPWILRLSLGIAFIGASTAEVFISPVLPSASFAVAQLVVGFMLMAGFLVFPASIAGIVLYGIALGQDYYLAGNIEILGGLVALIALGSARPGIDDLFGIPQMKMPRLHDYVPLILRIGIGGALLFLALYEKVFNPHVSELVVMKYGLDYIIPVGAAMWVFAVGAIEFFVGLFILLGFQTRIVSATAFVVLVVTFFFFKEHVYSHITLFGILSILFITGGGKASLDAFFDKRSEHASK